MLSAKEIQIALYREYRGRGWNTFSSNTKAFKSKDSWTYFEADFIGINKSLFITEFEIKRSRQDFWNEFENKKSKHRALKEGKHVNYFYFVCEKGLIKLDDIPDHSGLIYVEKIPKINKLSTTPINYKIEVVRTAPRLHTRKCSEYQVIQYLKSVMFKYFERLIAETNEPITSINL